MYIHGPLNTHSYDGIIDVNHLPDLILLRELALDEKKRRGNELLQVAKGIIDDSLEDFIKRDAVSPGKLNVDKHIFKMNDIAIKILENIIGSIGTALNIDNTNGLVADDLICMCWIYRHNHEFMKLLEMQLNDMATGFCPQGRTHRLFQTILAFV